MPTTTGSGKEKNPNENSSKDDIAKLDTEIVPANLFPVVGIGASSGGILKLLPSC